MSYIAKNIKWSIDYDDALEMIREAPYKRAAEILGVPEETYANMNDFEVNDYAYEWYQRGGKEEVIDLLGLPCDVEIPDSIEEDEIADYLTDTYDYCVEDYNLFECEDLREL